MTPQHDTHTAKAAELPERFWAKTRTEQAGYESACIVWIAYRMPNGYGRFFWSGEVRYAHRVAYEVLVRPIPEGLMIDHLCRNRACVNVEHLEPVTNQVNILRGETIMAAMAAKTHCKHGHPFDEANTRYDEDGHRACGTCTDGWREARNVQQRAERAAQPPKPPRTHCRNGHLLDEPNTYVNKKGVRCCRKCAVIATERCKERKVQLGNAWLGEHPLGRDGVPLGPHQREAIDWLSRHGSWDLEDHTLRLGRSSSDTRRVFEGLQLRGLVELSDGKFQSPRNAA